MPQSLAVAAAAIRPTIDRLLTLAIGVASTFAIVAGILAIVGWIADLPILADWTGSGTSMFVNTALCAVLCGVALLLLTPSSRHWQFVTVRVLAGIVGVIA